MGFLGRQIEPIFLMRDVLVDDMPQLYQEENDALTAEFP
jgi:hypothetical protein